jgi:hypothetical protein
MRNQYVHTVPATLAGPPIIGTLFGKCLSRKAAIIIFLVSAMLSVCGSAQTLESGGISFTIPVRGAWEFMLFGGGNFPVQPPMINGFHYADETFHLWQNGLPGFCENSPNPKVPGCRFDGTMGEATNTALDQYCSQTTFPLTGELQILNERGLNVYSNVTALYSQTYCDVNQSKFRPGGSLVVYLKGEVP